MSSVTPASAAASLTSLTKTAATTQVGPQANNTQMNQFLTLLTAQLKNQNPMQPTDPTQFVAQLAQFSSVEQLVQSNTKLDSMSRSLSGLALGQYSNMITHTVSASTTSVAVPGSGSFSSQMAFHVATPSLSKIHVEITDSAGKLVRSLPVSGADGNVTFNGKDANGFTLAAGQYNVSLVGTDSKGASQSAGTLSTTGVVSGVTQNASGAWQLQLKDGRTVDAASVTSVS